MGHFDEVKTRIAADPARAAIAAQQRGVIAVGRMVYEWRMAAGLSQAELAAIIGRQQESISRIERGMSLEGPKLPTLTAIADACGMRLVVGGSPSAVANEIDTDGAWSVVPSFGSTEHENEIAIATQLSGSERKNRAQSARAKPKALPETIKVADD